jgi:glyoxylase-like metal-dependent hydrolase (beta-lactamase superfamily II)
MEVAMKGLEFQILHMGTMIIDKGWHVAMCNPATRTNPNPNAILWPIPAIGILIRHPDAGYILFDTGWAPDTPRNPMWDETFPLEISREQFIDKQLEMLGLSVNDISMIVLSHMHWDHSGGLRFFSGTEAGHNIFVGKKDFTEALITTHTSCIPDSNNYYLRSILDIEDLDFNLVEEDTELAPGVELILLEGHTPGVLGILLHLEHGNYIMPSDAIFNSELYGPPINFPAILYDSFGFQRSIAKVRKLQERYGATIIYSHDPVTFKNYKLAPYTYR